MSKTRIETVTEQEFKRTLYRHPNTGQYFVEESHTLEIDCGDLEKELSIALFEEVNRINSER